MKDVYKFLKELRDNNERDWFNEHKDCYLEVKAKFEEFVDKVIVGLSKYDPDIAGLEAKDCTYRIYRDTRFSPDKTPYKTHFGAYLCKGGKKADNGGYYIHIQPDNTLFGGGIWCPPSPLLKALRQDIYDNMEEFEAILTDKEFSKHYVMDGEKLKKVPQPYPQDCHGGEYLKFKNYTVANYVNESFFNVKNPVDKTVERLKLMYPFNRFLNYTVDETMNNNV